jgi:hypothetical protein
MTGEELVCAEFRRVLGELGCASGSHARDTAGAGEGSLTQWVGNAFCRAEWWDRGGRFTLFLGRTWVSPGGSFACEFPVENLAGGEGAAGRPEAGLEPQIREQFGLLQRHGGPWLSGDFSQEPYIPHRVFPVRAELAPASAPDRPPGRKAHVGRPELFLMTVRGRAFLRCSVHAEGGARIEWTVAAVAPDGRIGMGAHEERVIQVKASLRQVRGLLALVHASAEFARRRDPKGARSDIDWAPSSGFIVLAARAPGGTGPSCGTISRPASCRATWRPCLRSLATKGL